MLDEYWSINFLKSSTDAAHATSWGKLFHGSTTLLVKKYFLAFKEDVRSLALPGSYHEKITHLGRSLASFTRLKHLDLARNAISSLEVT